MDMTKALVRRLTIEQANLKTQIESELKRGISSFQLAQEAVASGQELDEYLLQNMMLLVTHIARHNSMIKIMPYLKEDSE